MSQVNMRDMLKGWNAGWKAACERDQKEEAAKRLAEKSAK